MSKFRFQLLAGSHTELPTPDAAGVMPKDPVSGGPQLAVTYHYNKNGPPTYVDSDRELDKMFLNKFQRVDAQGHPVYSDAPRPVIPPEPGIVNEPSLGVPMPPATAPTGLTPPPFGGSEPPPPPPPGDDVTTDFPEASEAGLRVMKLQKEYFVVPANEPNKPVKDGAELTSKKQVQDAIKAYHNDKR